MLSLLGVDVTSIGYRYKFLFVAQVASPQKAQYEVRDNSDPNCMTMNVLARGRKQLFEITTFSLRHDHAVFHSLTFSNIHGPINVGPLNESDGKAPEECHRTVVTVVAIVLLRVLVI